MPKGYWVAHITIENAEPYTVYASGATAAFRKYGGRVLARGGAITTLEGLERPRNVVVEFDSVEAALRCYHSPEYQSAKSHRDGNAVGDIMIIEGAG